MNTVFPAQPLVRDDTSDACNNRLTIYGYGFALDNFDAAIDVSVGQYSCRVIHHLTFGTSAVRQGSIGPASLTLCITLHYYNTALYQDYHGMMSLPIQLPAPISTACRVYPCICQRCRRHLLCRRRGHRRMQAYTSRNHCCYYLQ